MLINVSRLYVNGFSTCKPVVLLESQFFDDRVHDVVLLTIDQRFSDSCVKSVERENKREDNVDSASYEWNLQSGCSFEKN